MRLRPTHADAAFTAFIIGTRDHLLMNLFSADQLISRSLSLGGKLHTDVTKKLYDVLGRVIATYAYILVQGLDARRNFSHFLPRRSRET